VDWLEPLVPPSAATPLLVLFHGLEGSSSSHSVRPFAQVAQALGWRMVAHHASPGSPHEVHEMAEVATVLH